MANNITRPYAGKRIDDLISIFDSNSFDKEKLLLLKKELSYRTMKNRQRELLRKINLNLKSQAGTTRKPNNFSEKGTTSELIDLRNKLAITARLLSEKENELTQIKLQLDKERTEKEKLKKTHKNMKNFSFNFLNNFSDAEIKKFKRTLFKAIHPDQNKKDPIFEEATKYINSALDEI